MLTFWGKFRIWINLFLKHVLQSEITGHSKVAILKLVTEMSPGDGCFLK